MIKKNILWLLVLSIATIITFSGCSQDAYSGFFSFMEGNVYSDSLGVVLPGESSSIFEAATANAITVEASPIAIGDSGDNSDAVDSVNSETGSDVRVEDNSGTEVDATSNGDGTATISGTSTKVIIEKETTILIPGSIEGLEDDPLLKVVAVSIKATSGENSLENVKLLLAANSTTTKKVLGVASVDETGQKQVSIPMFKASTEEEKDELAAQYGTQNEILQNKIKNLMKQQEQDPTKLIAAYNTTVAIENKAKTLASKFDSLTFQDDVVLDGESAQTISSKISSLAKSLSTPILSVNPTKEEILKVKLIYNVTSSLSDAIKSIMQDEGGNDKVTINIESSLGEPRVVAKLKKVLIDAETAIAVANLNSDNSTLLDDFDISSVLSAISDSNKVTKSLAKADDEGSLGQLNTIFEGNKATVRILLSSYVGIKKVGELYVYDESLNDANIISNEIISEMITAYLSVSYLAGDDEDSSLRDELSSDSLTGLDGLITYSLSFFLDNIDESLSNYTTAYNLSAGTNYTVKALVDKYLLTHVDLFDAIYGSGEIDASLFYEKDGVIDPIIGELNDSPDLDFTSILKNMFTVTDGHIGALEDFVDNCIQIDLNTEGGLGIISDKLLETKDYLEGLDL